MSGPICKMSDQKQDLKGLCPLNKDKLLPMSLLPKDRASCHNKGRIICLPLSLKQMKLQIIPLNFDSVLSCIRVTLLSRKLKQHRYRMRVFLLARVKNPGVYSQKNWVEVCGPLPKTLTLFMSKICDFPYPIYDLTKNLIPYL